jgi:hypothetical protein
MGTELIVALTETNENALDDIARLLVKLGLTGRPAASFTVNVADEDADRVVDLGMSLRGDPRVATVEYL